MAEAFGKGDRLEIPAADPLEVEEGRLAVLVGYNFLKVGRKIFKNKVLGGFVPRNVPRG